MEREIKRLAPWFHNLHLPGGVQTAPEHWLGDFPAFKWGEIKDCIPQDLTGWSALDIGCNAGFYSFKLAQRGADVLGIDANERYLDQAKWAAGCLNMQNRVRFEKMQIYDLAHMDECFDLVMFMGVFYHLRYPMLGMDIAAQKTKRLMVFQSLSLNGDSVHQETWKNLGIHDREPLCDPAWPKLAFIEHRFCDDPTNWWIPNRAAIEAMLRSSGMQVIASPAHEVFLAEPDTESVSCIAGWNRGEFLAATGNNRKGFSSPTGGNGYCRNGAHRKHPAENAK